MRFDLNDYSIPPEAVGRQLTLVASDTAVRILDGSVEIARHRRTYDRHQLVLDPAHQEAVLKIKRKAFHSTPAGRLEQAVPESKTLLDLAFAQGESAGSQTAQLMKLLDQYGAAALRRAIAEALERNTPRASSVAFLLRRQPRSAPPGLDLSHHPQAQSLDVRPHDLETYDELARTQRRRRSRAIVLPLNSSRSACAPCPRNWMTSSRAPPRPAGPLTRSWSNWPRRKPPNARAAAWSGACAISGIKSFKPMADFDWSWPTKIERDVIERALTLDFLREARNLILVGRNGLGKTMIAQNICSRRRAGRPFRAVSFRRGVAGRIAPPDSGRPPPQTAHLRQCRTCCASMRSGILSFDDKAADLLYEVVNRRYERKPVILTTNRPFKEWNEVFPNATCIVTLLDRLLHHADVTVIEGDSYRMRESEQETAARRRKK